MFGDDTPLLKKHKCARMNVIRMIFLAIDVMHVNYPIDLVNGRHL